MLMARFFGYPVLVDIFRTRPTAAELSRSNFFSDVYSVALSPPYDDDRYQMSKQGDGFSPANYREFELIYVPEEDGKPDSDECFIEYDWHAMKTFTAQEATVSLLGLPDLRGALYTVRLYTIPEFWGSTPPYQLEAVRMRVGANELMLTSDRFKSENVGSGLLVYQMEMPTRFDELLKLFTTVRSNDDTTPLPERQLRLSTKRNKP